MALLVRVREISLPAVDRRMIIGAVLAAIAALGVLQLTQPPERIPILVAGSELVAGRPLAELDVEVRYVESAVGLVMGDTLGDLGAWSLRVPLQEGEPLVASLLRPPELVASPNVIALSLDGAHAVLGRLTAGDRVDVYVTHDTFDSEPTTRLLAASVYVVDATVSESNVNRGRVNILLAVDGSLAAQIVSGSRTGAIDLVRLAP